VTYKGVFVFVQALALVTNVAADAQLVGDARDAALLGLGERGPLVCQLDGTRARRLRTRPLVSRNDAGRHTDTRTCTSTQEHLKL
jgi:hypothetical protein